MEVKFEKTKLSAKRQYIWNHLKPFCLHIALFLFCLALFFILFLTFSSFGEYASKLSSVIQHFQKNSDDRFMVGTHKVSLNIFNQISEINKEKNILFSPLGALLSLCMLLDNSWNESSAREFKEITNWDTMSQAELHDKIRTMLDDFQDGNKLSSLHIRSRVFLQLNAPFDDNFINILLRIYKTGFQMVDFEDVNSTKNAVDSWIESNHGNPKFNLRFSADDRAVLANNVQFKGRWKFPFSKLESSQAEFYMKSGVSRNVTMMYQIEEISFSDLGSFKVLELPYEDSDISMFVMLPEEGKALKWLREKMMTDPTAYLANIDQYLVKTKVQLCLPKIHLESSGSLRPALSAAGMGNLFRQPLENQKSPLRVSELYEEAKLSVDEEGTEASSISISKLSDRSSEAEFCANRPFLFFVRENKRKTLLFMGQFQGPDL